MVAFSIRAIGKVWSKTITFLFSCGKDRLYAGHGLRWLVVAVAFACLGFAPSLVDAVARWLGVEYPPVLALSMGMALLVPKLLLMDIERSRIAMLNQ